LDSDRVEKLKSFLLDKLNNQVEEIRVGCERMNQLYSLDLDMYHAPVATSLEGLAEKAQHCRKAFLRIEAVLTRYEGPAEAYRKQQLPRGDPINMAVNPCLEALDEAVSDIELRMHNINTKCQMALQMETPERGDWQNMKQFIALLVKKFQRIAGPWTTSQIFIITNNIDLTNAPQELLHDTSQLKQLFDNGLIDAKEFAYRRLQILDKIFFLEHKHDKIEKRRWNDGHNPLQALNQLYAERKVALPSHYDRQGGELDYEHQFDDDEEAQRLQALTRGLDSMASSQVDPRNRDYESEVAERRYQAAARYFEEKNAGRPDPSMKYKPAAATLRPDQVAADLERRRQQVAAEQQMVNQRRSAQVQNGGASRPAAAAPSFKGVPTTAEEVEAFKREMQRKYEEQARENAEILRKKKEAAGAT